MEKFLIRFLLFFVSLGMGSVAIAELNPRYHENLDVDSIFAHDDCLYFMVGDYKAMTICGAFDLAKLEQKVSYLVFLIQEENHETPEYVKEIEPAK